MQNAHTLFIDETEEQGKPREHVVLPPPNGEPPHDVLAQALLDDTFAHWGQGARESGPKSSVHIVLPPPKGMPLHEMFEETMLEDASAHFRHAAVESAADKGVHIILPPPKVEPRRDVFDDAILESSSAHQRRSPLDWAASIGVHVIVVGMLLILPLYFTSGLDFHKLNVTFLAAPAAPAAPPPPMAASVAARPARVVPVRAFVQGRLTAPTFIPKTVNTAPEAPAAAPAEAFAGVPGGIPGGQVGGVLGGILGGVGKGVPQPPPPAATGPKTPVVVGGSVKPPRLLFAPAPDYPVLARQAHLSGMVVIEAVIDEHGNVTGMRVVSGHPLLIPAALAAVSQRRYEPTVLDGEPTPVDLRVEIKFSFS